jgi:hypothetical protein
VHETLGGATAAAQQLPGQAGTALLDAAREAFTHGMHTTAVAGAVVMAATAMLAVMLLRNVQVDSAAGPADPERAIPRRRSPPLNKQATAPDERLAAP